MANENLLELRYIRKTFGGIVALDYLNFVMKPGEIVGIIGPNAAGKTSFLDCINGIQRIDSGLMHFQNQLINDKATHRISQLGIARVFSRPHYYPHLTVLEHLLLCHNGQLSTLFISERALLKSTWFNELCSSLKLEELFQHYPPELNPEQAIQLEFACALVSQPTLLLIDELIASHPKPAFLLNFLSNLHSKTGLSILLVEHNIQLVRGFCQRVLIMNSGKIIADGSPEEVLTEDMILQAFFII